MIVEGDELANETMLLKKQVEFSYCENVIRLVSGINYTLSAGIVNPW